jgi:hypothetical protein
LRGVDTELPVIDRHAYGRTRVVPAVWPAAVAPDESARPLRFWRELALTATVVVVWLILVSSGDGLSWPWAGAAIALVLVGPWPSRTARKVNEWRGPGEIFRGFATLKRADLAPPERCGVEPFAVPRAAIRFVSHFRLPALGLRDEITLTTPEGTLVFDLANATPLLDELQAGLDGHS